MKIGLFFRYVMEDEDDYLFEVRPYLYYEREKYLDGIEASTYDIYKNLEKEFDNKEFAAYAEYAGTLFSSITFCPISDINKESRYEESFYNVRLDKSSFNKSHNLNMSSLIFDSEDIEVPLDSNNKKIFIIFNPNKYYHINLHRSIKSRAITNKSSYTIEAGTVTINGQEMQHMIYPLVYDTIVKEDPLKLVIIPSRRLKNHCIVSIKGNAKDKQEQNMVNKIIRSLSLNAFSVQYTPIGNRGHGKFTLEVIYPKTRKDLNINRYIAYPYHSYIFNVMINEPMPYKFEARITSLSIKYIENTDYRIVIHVKEDLEKDNDNNDIKIKLQSTEDKVKECIKYMKEDTELNKYGDCEFDYKSYYKSYTDIVVRTSMYKHFVIKDIKFNGPATIVFWEDGEKTVVSLKDEKVYDFEKALAFAFVKKALSGGKIAKDRSINRLIDKWTPKFEEEKSLIKKQISNFNKKKKLKEKAEQEKQKSLESSEK